MSEWSSASTGKPQLSYAERLRRAQEEPAKTKTQPASSSPLTQLQHQKPENGTPSPPAPEPSVVKRASILTNGAPDAEHASAPARGGNVAVAGETVPATNSASATPAESQGEQPRPSKTPPVNVWELRKKALAERDADKAKSPLSRATVDSSSAQQPIQQSTAARADVTTAEASPEGGHGGEGSTSAREGQTREVVKPSVTASEDRPPRRAQLGVSSSIASPPDAASESSPPTALRDVGQAGASASGQGKKHARAAKHAPTSSTSTLPDAENAWLERISMLNGGQNMPSMGAALESGPNSSRDQHGVASASDDQDASSFRMGDQRGRSGSTGTSGIAHAKTASSATSASQSTDAAGVSSNSRRKPNPASAAGKRRKSGRGSDAGPTGSEPSVAGPEIPSFEDESLWPSPIAATHQEDKRRPGGEEHDETHGAESKATSTTETPAPLEGLDVQLARPVDKQKKGKQWIPIVPTITHTTPLPNRDKKQGSGGTPPSQRSNNRSTSGQSQGGGGGGGAEAGRAARRPSRAPSDGVGRSTNGRVDKGGASIAGKGGAEASTLPTAARDSNADEASHAKGDDEGEIRQTNHNTETVESMPVVNASNAGDSVSSQEVPTPLARLPSRKLERPAHLPPTPPKTTPPPYTSAGDSRAQKTLTPMTASDAPPQAFEPSPRLNMDGSFSPKRRSEPFLSGHDGGGRSGNFTPGGRGRGRGRGRGGWSGGAPRQSLPHNPFVGAYPQFDPARAAPPPEAYAMYAPQTPFAPPFYAPPPGYVTPAPPGGVWFPALPGRMLLPNELGQLPPDFTPPPAAGQLPPGSSPQLLTQVEFYFSHQNLQGDYFLRQCMDAEGWVDIDLVASFNRVRQLTPDAQLVKQTLRHSAVLHVDAAGDRVRKAIGWEMYVLPGAQPSATMHHAGHNPGAAPRSSPGPNDDLGPASRMDQGHNAHGYGSAENPSATNNGIAPGGAASRVSLPDAQSSSTQLTGSSVSKVSTAPSSPPSATSRSTSQHTGEEAVRQGLQDEDDEETLGVVAAEGLAGTLAQRSK